jgi:hypothetical protein
MKSIVEFVRKATKRQINSYKIPFWYPKGIKLPSNADREYVEALFGKSQLIILSHLMHSINSINDEQSRELLRFAFSGILARASLTYAIDTKKAGGGDSGIFKVFRYWVPPSPDYRDVWDLFVTRVKLLKQIKQKSNGELKYLIENPSALQIICASAENLLDYTKENSVNFIYTDPPYGSHISYLDLSTMWHAWLGLEVTTEMRMNEAIEGGDLQFNEKHYISKLNQAFEKMFLALKDNGWLSLVFHHKKTNLWYSIRDMMKYIGFTYINTVAQPLSKQTFHKVKNPLRVLGESLIVNFQKSTKRFISVPMSLPLANIIKNIAERVIYKNGGATTEEILREVVPDLFENELFIDAATKSMSDILGILESDFDLDSSKLWQIRAERKVGNFIPPKLRIQYYIIGYLRKYKRADFDSIVTTILPLLINGHKPTKDDIADVLREIARSNDGVHWELTDPNAVAVQNSFYFEQDVKDEIFEVPDSTTHNQQIYRLAVLCRKLGFVPCIGKKERSDPMFATLKSLSSLNIEADDTDRRRIEQIDIIWADDAGKPIWAFEIEEHTSILSALERFISLLKVAPTMGKDRRLTIVAPRTRRKKLYQELSSSSYIGHPQYLENKLTYIFNDELEKFFLRSRAIRVLQLSDVTGICKIPEK